MPTPHTELYHFTDTVRLPWIVDADGLRLYRNQIGGLPSPDFLWATTSSQVEPADPEGLDRTRHLADVHIGPFKDDLSLSIVRYCNELTSQDGHEWLIPSPGKRLLRKGYRPD